jgi:type IV pilus assembly protein PilC
MKKYNYKGKNKQGKTISGLVEALNEKEAVRILREKQLVPFDLKEKGRSELVAMFSSFMGVSSKDITEFTRQLATMVSAGLSLTSSLTIIQEQSKPALSKILTEIVKEIEGGSTFYEALAKYPNTFSKTYIALVKSGEASGALDEVLKKMSDALEKQEEFKGKVKGAMIYPAIVVVGMIGVIAVMMIFVIPKMTSMYEEFGTDLPASTKLLMSTSDLFSKFWFIALGLIIGAAYLFKTWHKTKQGRKQVDELMLKLPIIGNLKSKIILTDVARTLAMLLSAGVTIIDSLNISAEAADNAVFEESMKSAAKDVEKGLPLTATFEKFEQYPPIFAQMVAVGEETGKLDEVLLKLSKQFEMESEIAVKGLTTAIEPLMMVVLGIGVGFIVMSIITPIYNLTSQF